MNRVLTSLLVVLAATGCGGDDSDAPQASPQPTLPSLASTPAKDGMSYGLIRATDGKTVIWDPIQFRADACAAGFAKAISYKERFETCYANPDKGLVSASLEASTTVRVRPGNGPSRTVKATDLPDEIGDDAGNNVPDAYRVWRITVRDSKVVSVDQTSF